LEPTSSKDALHLLAQLLTASELFLPAALKAKLVPLLLTLAQTTPLLPSVESKTFLLSELMEMEVLLSHGKHALQPLLTLLNTLVVT